MKVGINKSLLVNKLILKVFLLWLVLPGQLHAGTGMDSLQLENHQVYPEIKPVGFVQQHFSIDNIEDNPLNFSIHRARLGFSGHLNERIRLNFVIGALEPPNREPALVNAFVDFNLHPLFNLQTGQFLVPFGIEGPEPINLNPAIERSIPSLRMNTYRMFRDVGIMAYGAFSFVSYSVAVVNGNGANVVEDINPKDIVFRTIFNVFSGLDLGFSGQVGKYESGLQGNLGRQRWAAHAEYNRNKIFLRTEFMALNIESATDLEKNISLGGYLLGGFRLKEKWDIISRFEYYQPDNQLSSNYHGFMLGGNYFITKKTRLSLNGIGYTDTDNREDIRYVVNVQLQVVL